MVLEPDTDILQRHICQRRLLLQQSVAPWNTPAKIECGVHRVTDGCVRTQQQCALQLCPAASDIQFKITYGYYCRTQDRLQRSKLSCNLEPDSYRKPLPSPMIPVICLMI